MIIITGGAGFIGSAVVAALNERSRSDLLVVDDVDHPRKARNLAPLRIHALVPVGTFLSRLEGGEYANSTIEGVIHLGACSNTTEQNWTYLQENNVDYSKRIISWCADHGVRCVYASSAATYGDGARGFSDAHDLFDELEPLNPYGQSKLVVDIWARDNGLLAQAAGIRYFNVYGPNEWHKEGMRSVINKKFDELQDRGIVALFKSYHPAYADGAQERDFIYVADAVAITLWLLDHPAAVGVFNVGAGVVHTWNDVAHAMFAAVEKPPRIEYVEMPASLQAQYQYHTKADLTKLRAAGCGHHMMALEAAVGDYVRNHLLIDKHLRE